METDQKLPSNFSQHAELTIPEFGNEKSLTLNFTAIKEGEGRISEARIVNGATYNELEYVFNEGYRQARVNLAEVGYKITRAQKIWRDVKSRAILDDYPEFLKNKGLKDNATIRDAFLETYDDYVKAQDRIDMLTALQDLLEGKIKNFENICRYMRKQIDIDIRSGVDSNKYIR
jgi:hypothetical protein